MLNIGLIGDSILDPFFSSSPVTEQTEVAMLLMNALGESYASIIQEGTRAGNPSWTWWCPLHTNGKAYISNYKFTGAKYTMWNGACAGDSTAAISSRVDETFDGIPIDILVIQGGVNDASAVMLGGQSVTNSMNNIRQTITTAKSMGIERFVLCTVAPLQQVRSGYDYATWRPIQDAYINDLNALIRQECIDYGYSLADFHDAVHNPSAPNDWHPNYLLDGIHGNVAAQTALLSTFDLVDFTFDLDVKLLTQYDLDVILEARKQQNILFDGML